MAIEKTATPFPLDEDMLEEDDGIDVEIDDPVVLEDPEGGVVISFSDIDTEDMLDAVPHDANLAEYIDDKELKTLAMQLVEEFEGDRDSRKDWAEAYVKGLDLLGMKIEDRSQPWEGASGVFHPMLTEAVVRFEAQAMGELFPAAGPAKTKIMGKITPEKMAAAERVQQELNYQLTEMMPEYREEMEQMLFRLPLAGSAFKKVYFDPLRNRAVGAFVTAEDFVVAYGISDLQTAERYTHVMKKTQIEIQKLQDTGFYADVELGDPVMDKTDIQEKYDELNGEESVLGDDGRYTILEMHVTLTLPEMNDDDETPLPYVITVEKGSQTILSIRRNWYADDELQTKRMHFVHYRYLPGMGFYGTGLIQLMGGLTKTATALLRQLIDAGTLSNLPAGLKSRDLRIKGDNTPLQPGEWRDADVTGGTLRDSLFPMPYGEPSTVLHQLLGNVVDEGRRIGSVADVQVGDMNSEAPVGTTLALLEQSMKVMTGVQARLHASQKKELRLLARVIHDFMPDEYDYEMDGNFSRKDDFSGKIDVIPVSDPNAATMAQRVVQYQAALQMSQSAPEFYNRALLHRQMLEVLGIKDAAEIVKLPEDIKAKDPVSENMAILTQEAIKVFAYQDHAAHIAVHMAAAQDPKIQQMVGQSPFAGVIQAAFASHITEHVAMEYRVEIQKQLGVEMPDPETQLPEDVEREVSRLAAAAAQKLLQQHQGEAQAQMQAQQEKDPLNIIQRAELDIKKAELDLKKAEAEHKALMDMDRLRLDEKIRTANIAVQSARIDSEAERAGAQIGAKLATQTTADQKEAREKGIELGLRVAEEMVKGANDGPDRSNP